MSFLLVTGLAAAALAAETGDCFPDRQGSKAPGQRYEIVYKWEDDLHRLYFRKAGQRRPEKLLDFFRSACVHWSPSGYHFTVTDHVGSNVAVVDIVDSGRISRRTSVSDLLPAAVRDLMSGSLHGYLETVAWDRGDVIVRAFGDREHDPKAFDVRLRCKRERARWTCATADR